MSSHYFDQQQSSPLRPQKISFSVLGREFSATTGSGTFSRDGLDNATRLLIETCSLRGDERVLDLGCGWGPVGLALKSAHPGISLVMSDVNRRAVMLSRQNMADASLEADIVVSDGFERLKGPFETILLNPPYAAGRDVCYGLIDASFEHLCSGGRLLLVARHQKGGKMLQRHIEEVFGSAQTLAKKGGFRVYEGSRA